MLLIPRLPVPLPRVLKPQRIAIDGPGLYIQRAGQLAVERRPSSLGRLDNRVVRGADFVLVGIVDRHGEAVVRRVRARAFVQLVLDCVHAAPAGRIASGEGLGW